MGQLELEGGRPAEARRWIDQGLGIVEAPAQDNLIEQAHLYHLRGRVELSTGRTVEAKRSFGEAGSRYNGIKNRYHLHLNNLALEKALQPVLASEPAVAASRPRPVEAQWQLLRTFI
jgi:hypothetical protein